MNPDYMNVEDHYPDSFNYKAEWFEFYGDFKEDILKNVTRELGKGVEVIDWVNADHTGEKLSRCSHNGILIFVDSAPTIWYSKSRQKLNHLYLVQR